MTNPPNRDSSQANYALRLADESYEWYRNAAIKARRYYRLSESMQITLAAAIPVVSVLFSSTTAFPAILGGLVVVLTGLRSIFHWHDDYLRFSEAREAVEAERRLYITQAEPYDNQRRDQLLVGSITRIERQEMGRWKDIASRSRKSKSERTS